MLSAIDNFIDQITMYRLLIYYLVGLLAAAVGLSVTGGLHMNPLDIAVSSGILVAACWALNTIFGYIFAAPVHGESAIITGLILALIITPDLSKIGITFLLAASGLAMASKFVLAIHRKHIFNPAAAAVALTALGPKLSASWWVGTAVMLPLVIIGGLLIIRKVRRISMFAVFFIVSTIVTAGMAAMSHQSVATSLHNMLFSSAICFLGFVMLTEPLTSPTSHHKQLWYGAIVGALLAPQIHLLSYYTSPEIALLVGNVYAYIVNSKARLFLTLKEKVRIAANTADFIFDPGGKLAFQPGQYMEFTLPHSRPDDRGTRRYFTLASSPTEPTVRLGVKFYEPGSSYKQAMLDMDDKTPFVAAQVAGDFVMPKDPNAKLAFIAGGIGITPFRSMVKYMLDANEQRSVVMLYSARTRNDLAYGSVFEEARRKLDMQTTYVLTGEQEGKSEQHVVKGAPITKELITQTIPDYRERTFYISGTHEMVRSIKEILLSLGVARRHIKIDFFPGYA